MATHSNILVWRTTWTVWKDKKMWCWKVSLPGLDVSSCYWGRAEGITNTSNNNEVAGLKQKQHSAVDVSDGESKVQCYKEVHCIGTWNVSSTSSVQSLSRVTAACQASLSITNFQSLLKLMTIELVILSNHLILCRPLLFLCSIFPSIRVFSNESVLCIRWPKYWGLLVPWIKVNWT